MEPRPFDEDLVKDPVYSVLGNPVSTTMACAFTGYPPPEVWIEKNKSVIVSGIESVWINLTTDSLDDYGVYYCVGENVVSLSKLNYTFEIRRSGLSLKTLIRGHLMRKSREDDLREAFPHIHGSLPMKMIYF